MRRNMGYPPALTFMVTYSGPAHLPSDVVLTKRIYQLQENVDLLRCRIRDRRTERPFFERVQVWPADKILRYIDHGDLIDHDTILLQQLHWFEKNDVDRMPMWNVTVHRTSGSAYLTISAVHEIIDGIGLANLVQLLLNKAPIRPERLSAPTLEQAVDLRPSLLYLLPVLFRFLLLPRLPQFIQTWFYIDPPWPVGIASPYFGKASAILTLKLTAADVSALKEVGRRHGVHTLHPILQTAALIAIWSTFGDDIRPFVLRSSSPRSLRISQPGLPSCSGNFGVNHTWDYRPEPSDDFWHEAHRFAKYLHSERGKHDARQRIGMLAYLPEGSHDPDSDRPTAWEEFYFQQAEGQPFSDSLDVSNLGSLSLPAGAEDLCWAISCPALAPAINIQLVGHEKGVRATFCWREGAAVKTSSAQRVSETFLHILSQLAKGDILIRSVAE